MSLLGLYMFPHSTFLLIHVVQISCGYVSSHVCSVSFLLTVFLHLRLASWSHRAVQPLQPEPGPLNGAISIFAASGHPPLPLQSPFGDGSLLFLPNYVSLSALWSWINLLENITVKSSQQTDPAHTDLVLQVLDVCYLLSSELTELLFRNSSQLIVPSAVSSPPTIPNKVC